MLIKEEKGKETKKEIKEKKRGNNRDDRKERKEEERGERRDWGLYVRGGDTQLQPPSEIKLIKHPRRVCLLTLIPMLNKV